jgi:DNA-binding FrmR family transcriptional regulator
LNGLAKALLSEHIRTCVAEDVRHGSDETLDELLDTLQKWMK